MISMNLAVIFIAKLHCHKKETINLKKKECIKEKV